MVCCSSILSTVVIFIECCVISCVSSISSLLNILTIYVIERTNEMFTFSVDSFVSCRTRIIFLGELFSTVSIEITSFDCRIIFNGVVFYLKSVEQFPNSVFVFNPKQFNILVHVTGV